MPIEPAHPRESGDQVCPDRKADKFGGFLHLHPGQRTEWDSVRGFDRVHRCPDIPIQTDLIQGFTAKYGVDLLLWYEVHESRAEAFKRERQIKKWNRLCKLELIEKSNPEWRDLFDDLFAP